METQLNSLVEPTQISSSKTKIKPCILFVDDDQLILDLLSRIFKDTNYKTIACNSAEIALGHLEKYDIDVIVSDVRMPGMSGTDLFDQVKKTNPEIIRIAMSGAFDQHNTIELINKGDICSYVIKPFSSPKDLKLVIYNKLYERDRKREEVDRLKARQRNAAVRAKQCGKSLHEVKTFADDIRSGVVHLLTALTYPENLSIELDLPILLCEDLSKKMEIGTADCLQLEVAIVLKKIDSDIADKLAFSTEKYHFLTNALNLSRSVGSSKSGDKLPAIFSLVQAVTKLIQDENLTWQKMLEEMNSQVAHFDSEVLFALNDIDNPLK
jgi:CheY-like chemotaxis protein